MSPKKPRRVAPPRGDNANFDHEETQYIDAGKPTYHYPITGTPKRVQAVVVDELQVLDAGPRLTPEEWQAWRAAKQPRGVAVRDPEPDGPPAEEVAEPTAESDELPTEEEIAKLPRWARVAFAARCARLAQLLLINDWKDAPEEHLLALENEIAGVENSAAMASFDLYQRRHTAAAAYVSVIAAHSAKSQTVIKAAEAAEVAYGSPVAAASLAVEAGVPLSIIAREYKKILRTSEIEKWDHSTPVPPTVFGQLWPEGPPPGWPADENPNREIELAIDLPDNATDADVKRYVELLVGKADDVYRAGGGNGLKISGLDITGDKLAEKPSPTSDEPDAVPVGGGKP